MNASPDSPKPKPKTIAVPPPLHHCLRLLATLRNESLSDVSCAPLWKLVSDNREALERMTGGKIEIPEIAA